MLVLRDADEIPGAALYVKELFLGTGLDQIPLITGNGSNIYYAARRPATAISLAGRIHLEKAASLPLRPTAPLISRCTTRIFPPIRDS